MKTTYIQEVLGKVLAPALLFSVLGSQGAFAIINNDLDFGDRGSEVTELQTYLATDQAIYPSRMITGYFGSLTQAGVKRFQATQGIVSSGTPSTTGYGRVGPMTRTAINAKLGGGVSTNPTDIDAPLIKSVNVRTDNDGASITWTASESSMGKVYYSTSPLQVSNTFDSTGVFSGEPVVSGTLAQYDGISRATHTVNINNLNPNTTYFYLVVVFDSSKNVSITSPSSFRTTQ